MCRCRCRARRTAPRRTGARPAISPGATMRIVTPARAARPAGRPCAGARRHGRNLGIGPVGDRQRLAAAARAIVEDAALGRPVDRSDRPLRRQVLQLHPPIGIGRRVAQPPRPLGDPERRVAGPTGSVAMPSFASASHAPRQPCRAVAPRAARPAHARTGRRRAPCARHRSRPARNRGTQPVGAHPPRVRRPPRGDQPGARPPVSGAGAWPSPVNSASGACPDSRSRPRSSARPSAPPPSASQVRSGAARHRHGRAPPRGPSTRHSARPAPSGSAPVRPAARRARRRARRSPPRRGRRASWDHFKKRPQHVH
jgi:hypothetical protein